MRIWDFLVYCSVGSVGSVAVVYIVVRVGSVAFFKSKAEFLRMQYFRYKKEEGIDV